MPALRRIYLFAGENIFLPSYGYFIRGHGEQQGWFMLSATRSDAHDGRALTEAAKGRPVLVELWRSVTIPEDPVAALLALSAECKE